MQIYFCSHLWSHLPRVPIILTTTLSCPYSFYDIYACLAIWFLQTESQIWGYKNWVSVINVSSCLILFVFIDSEPSCHFCKRNALPQYQATLPEGKVLSFCSSQCVTKFQVLQMPLKLVLSGISVEPWVEELKLVHASLNARNVHVLVHNSNVLLVALLSKCPLQNATIQTSANGQLPTSASENIQLKCNYCRGSFNLKPEILEWEVRTFSISLLFNKISIF